MSFKVVLHPRNVANVIDELPRSYQEKVVQFIEFLRENPYRFQERSFILSPDRQNYDIKKCKGHQNRYRARFGSFRITYEIYKFEKMISILKLETRGHIY